MVVYYRISDNSYVKGKLPGATKEFCLRNFISVFGDDQMTILCDNCQDSTVSMCKSVAPGARIAITSEGNAGALRTALSMALSHKSDEVIYVVEDDYLHLKSSGKFNRDPVRELHEGLQFGDYVTLYDHPDKYLSEYGYAENAKVFRSAHSHWRTSISTTMTFCTTVEKIRKDQDIWWHFTEGSHPNDHQLFTNLTGLGRKLVVSIPGLACHVDLTYSDAKNMCYIDPWAFDILEDYLEAEVIKGTPDFKRSDIVWAPGDGSATESTQSLKRLMMLCVLAKK